PTDIARLFETRQRVSGDRYELVARAWTAFRQSSPETLDELRRRTTGVMPFLSAALKRFLQEYPWTTDGLSRCERRLLTIAASGPVDLLEAFSVIHDGETAYNITDLSFLELLKDCSGCAPPLISVADIPFEMGRIPNGTLTITERGRSVLKGDVDRIASYGI